MFINKYYVFFFCLLFSSCPKWKTYPTYNPFDAIFQVSLGDLKDSGSKLLYQPCGFKTYGLELNGATSYYQFNPNSTIVAMKGLTIVLDSFLLEKSNNLAFLDTIITKNLDTILILLLCLIFCLPMD